MPYLCILSGEVISRWLKSQRTIYGKLLKKTKSGQASKKMTARQKWVVTNLSVRAPTRQLGRVLDATLDEDEEQVEEEHEDDASSTQASQPPAVASSQLPGPRSKVPARSSSSSSKTRPGKKGGSATKTGPNFDDAIFSIVNRMESNANVQQKVDAAVKLGGTHRVNWCQWMGTYLRDVSDDLWDMFMDDTFPVVQRIHSLHRQRQQ
jgi:hypothetical protein